MYETYFKTYYTLHDVKFQDVIYEEEMLFELLYIRVYYSEMFWKFRLSFKAKIAIYSNALIKNINILNYL